MLWMVLVRQPRCSAQQPPVHYLHHGIMPPGAIGSQQLQRGGPLPGFFQPVEIKAPPGALVSLAVDNQFDEAQPAPRKAGFLIGAVYRLRVTNIRLAEGLEVFPTIEVIDRLYTPADQQRRFAIPIDITEEDLKLALARQVRHAGDLPRRSAPRLAGARQSAGAELVRGGAGPGSAGRGRRPWAGPWPSCDSGRGCPIAATMPDPELLLRIAAVCRVCRPSQPAKRPTGAAGAESAELAAAARRDARHRPPRTNRLAEGPQP